MDLPIIDAGEAANDSELGAASHRVEDPLWLNPLGMITLALAIFFGVMALLLAGLV